MGEVAVAFPNDETTAEVIASRLRVDGIAARVDRGLHGSSWQVPARGHITILVDARDAARAHKVLGTSQREVSPPSRWSRLAIAVLFAALALGVVAIILALVPR